MKAKMIITDFCINVPRAPVRRKTMVEVGRKEERKKERRRER